MGILKQTNDEADFQVVTGAEDGAAIPWDTWLERLEAIRPEADEWSRAEECAASVLAVAENKRRSSENEAQFHEALASLAAHTELVCYLELVELADWDARDVHPQQVAQATQHIRRIRAELEEWRRRHTTGGSTAREDSAATRRIADDYRRARAMRFWRERPETDADAVRYPRCGSSDVRCSPPQSIRDRVMAVVFDVDPVRCRACRNRFRAPVEAESRGKA